MEREIQVNGEKNIEIERNGKMERNEEKIEKNGENREKLTENGKKWGENGEKWRKWREIGEENIDEWREK